MENGDANAISGSPSACLPVSVARGDANVDKNRPERRYWTRFVLNNRERLFEPNSWLPKNTVFKLSLSRILNILGTP